MSNYSERILQKSLHQAGFYTQKSPSSGTGILDPETEEHIDQADIVAIRAETHTYEDMGGNLIDRTESRILIIEEKHIQPDTCPITDEKREQLRRIQAVTAADPFYAVKWKNQPGGHRFYHLDELQDTGQHWKITQDQPAFGIEEITAGPMAGDSRA